MAVPDDAATVLESFVHDVANLPHEIQHLMEEIQAKDKLIQDCRNEIDGRDNSLQKHIKEHGSLQKHPKEEAYSRVIRDQYDKAIRLQQDKQKLADRAMYLLDRHCRRLDQKIQDLQGEGAMPFDHHLPSLLRDSPGNKVAPTSTQSTGVSTPLNPLSGNAGGGAPNIANAALAARMANSGAVGRVSSPAATTPTNANPSHASNAPAVAAMAINSERSMSVGSDTKRRRLNTNVGPTPTPTSGLARQSSLGPGTPKPSTPGSRAGSAGPRPAKKTTKKVAPNQMRKKIATKKGMPKNASRRLISGNKNSPSTTGDDDSVVDEDEGSEEENASGAEKDAPGDEDGMDVDEDEGDDTKYCTCQRVSFGDMVGCDNEECPFQWFHWECVGLKEEPQGEWLCPTCRDLKPSQIKRAK